MKKYTLLIALTVFIAAGILEAAGTVKGRVTYTASAATGTWTGVNDTLTGEISISPVTGKICIQMKGWNSGNARRDSHTFDMFETDKYPLSCFTIKSIEGNTVKGDLEMHGVVKPVSFSGSLKKEGNRLIFSGKTVLMADDFALVRPVLLGMKPDNEVTVEVRTEGGL
jgi:polyisoprenoid-binding protein YceI